MTKYKEIFKLKQMLEDEGIELKFNSRREKDPKSYDHYQIEIMQNNGSRLISVIQGYGTYGENKNKLEIMGLLTDEEQNRDSVVGWLTADDVFARIKNAKLAMGGEIDAQNKR